MSSTNLDVVRSVYGAWEAGDYFGSVEWADPGLEFVVVDGPSPGGLIGVAAVENNWREFQAAWDDYRVRADEYRELDEERVLVLVELSGRGKVSGLEMRQMAASLFTLRSGKVARLVIYWDAQHALRDLGLTPA